VSPQIWDCQVGNVNQKWRMTVGYRAPGSTRSVTIHAGDAYVLLAGNGASNMALDTNGNFSNGALPSLQTGIDTNKDDKFLIVAGSAPGTWTFKTQWNSGMCLDNPGGQSADGTGIQLWSCNGGSNQNWIISNRSRTAVSKSKNQQSAKCLTHQPGANGGGNGTSIVITDCNGYDYSQIWLFTTN
jgi:hypothetical protein